MTRESFDSWASRTDEHGYDLSEILTFCAAARMARLAEGNTGNPEWAKTEGERSGKGRVPAKLTNPETGDSILMPLVDVSVDGPKVEAFIVTPTCPACGSCMGRKTSAKRDFFACMEHPRCKQAVPAWSYCGIERESDGVGIEHKPEPKPEPVKTEPKPEPKPVKKAMKPLSAKEKKAAKLAQLKALALKVTGDVIRLVEAGRKVVAEHGMTLPLSHTTVAQMTQMGIGLGSAEAAWRLWIDGRVSDAEREKFDTAGLPSGRFEFGAGEPGQDEPSWYFVAGFVLDLGLAVFLTGPTQSGKTRFAYWYAKTRGLDLSAIMGSQDFSAREFWCSRVELRKGETKEVPGPALKAIGHGETGEPGVLFLDEMCAFAENALLPLNGILDGRETLDVPVFGKVTVKKGFKLIAADNTNGRSMDRTYAGRSRLDGAFLNRFACVIKTTYLPEVDKKVAKEAADKALASMDTLGLIY